MTTGRGWYVKGRKYAFPYGERLCSGPFDDSGDAFAEARRIRPFYPDAHLDVVLEVGRTLPERTPRSAPPGAEKEAPMFDLRNAPGRLAAADAIALRCARYGVTARVEVWDGEPDVDFSVPFLRANIWLAYHAQAPMPIISWIAGEGLKLRAVLPGAWREEYPHRKATSLPETWPALFEALEVGLAAGIDGTAIEREI